MLYEEILKFLCGFQAYSKHTDIYHQIHSGNISNVTLPFAQHAITHNIQNGHPKCSKNISSICPMGTS